MIEKSQSDLELEVYEFLLSVGYTRDQLATESRISDRCYVDIAIVDPDREQHLAFIEIKAGLSPQKIDSAFQQLDQYAKAANTAGVRLYVVTPATNRVIDHAFDFYYKDDTNGKIIQFDPREFPTFASLSSDITASKKDTIQQAKKTATDRFMLTCWILAFVMAAITIADFTLELDGVTLISSTRLTLIGIVVALVIIPFAQKLKILGIEYERWNKPR